MALTPDNSTALIPQFKGSSQAQDQYQIDPAHGFLSVNNDFVLGQAESVQVATRRGTSQVVQVSSTDGAISTIASWYFSFAGAQNCYVAMYSAINGVRFWDQSLSLMSQIIIAVTGAAGAVFVFDGIRCYVSFFDSTGRKGISQGYIFGLFTNDTFGFPAVDTLFASPIPLTIATVATSQPGVGVVTAGTHRLGYIFTTRNGYTGALNPVTAAGVFAPLSFVAADGVHNLQVVVTWASIPTYISPAFPPTDPTIQIVMTTAANPARYFLVPGAIGGIPLTPGTTTITLSITDGDLAQGTDITQNQNLLTAVNNAGPFNPSSIFSYSSRMGYITLFGGFPTVFFSDQNDYQHITAAFHSVSLEARQIPVHGCSLGGLCYIATLQALYSTQDNGGLPETWTPPARIDGSVGVLSPTCLLAVGGKMLLASEKGLYLYRGGSFPQIPLSYWQQPDWNRINWAQPTQVQVIDDALDRVIRVLAPLNVIITAASNTNPIEFTTAVLINNVPVAYPHLYQTGLTVTVAGIAGNTAANATAVITVTGANTFTIPVAGNGAYVPGDAGWSGTAIPSRPNAEMCWAYPDGDDPGECWYSIHAFGAYRAASMATVRNISTDQDETWFGPATSNPGNLIRRVLPTDVNVYRDVDLSGASTAINSQYETSFAPGSQDESMTIHDYNGAHMRVSGSGSLAVAAYGLDRVRSVIPLASPLTLSKTPGKEYLMKWFLRSEQQSISFGTNGIDQYFIMALLRVYFTNSLPQR